MNRNFQHIVDQFKLQTRLFANVIKDLEQHKMTRPSPDTNHIGWLAGHIVSSRCMLGGLIGLELEGPAPELFANGKGIEEGAEYPSIAECLKVWVESSEKILSAMSSLSDTQLAAEAPFAVPTGKTIGNVLTFFAHHESYHIGQIGILRRYFGKEAMAYS